MSKQDFTKALITFVKVPAADISQLQIDRLFSVISINKSDYLRLCDFEKLLGQDLSSDWQKSAKN